MARSVRLIPHIRIAASLFALLGLCLWLFGANEPDFSQDFNVYFGNLHAHTAFSDGSGFPEEAYAKAKNDGGDRKSTRLNSSHIQKSRMPSSA